MKEMKGKRRQWKGWKREGREVVQAGRNAKIDTETKTQRINGERSRNKVGAKERWKNGVRERGGEREKCSQRHMFHDGAGRGGGKTGDGHWVENRLCVTTQSGGQAVSHPHTLLNITQSTLTYPVSPN